MNKRSVFLGILGILVFAVLMGAFFQTGEDLFQKALRLERNEGKLVEAIELYNQVVKDSGNKSLAAKAQLRIGLCYEKLGSSQIEQARIAFERVIENFPAQSEEVKIAREKLSLLERARAIVEKEDQGIKITEIPIDQEKMAYSFLSPDAKKLAYVSKDFDIWIYEIATGNEFQLTQTDEREIWCIWSPDSQKIALNDGQRNLLVVPAQGGKLKMLIDNNEEFRKEYLQYAPWSWSSDSQKIYCMTVNKGLLAVPINGGDLEIVYEYTRPDQWQSEYMLCISPNEKFLAYCQYSSPSDIFVKPVEGGEPIQITNHPAHDQVMRWSYDGHWLLFSSDRNGQTEPWVVGISPEGKRDGEPFQVPFMTKANLNLLRWAQGGKIGMTHYWNISHLFTANADGSGEKQLTKMDWAYWLPRWSPDDKYIAFGASQPQSGNIYITPVQGGEPKNISDVLFSRPGVENISDIRWHPNGRNVSCVVDRAEGRGIWNIEIESGSVQKIPFDYEGQIFRMDWSPDGKRIAFSYMGFGDPNDITDSEFFHRNIYTMSAEGGEVTRLTRIKEENFLRPLWSPDGQRIIFLDSAGRIWITSSEGGEPKPIKEKEEGLINLISWSPDGENIYFSRIEAQKSVYYSMSFQGGEARKLGLERLSGFSPDGKKIVYEKTMKQVREFWLLENFLPERKKD